MTSKRSRFYQVGFFVITFAFITLCAFMGITAIQKSMTLKLQFNSEPAVSCEFAIRQADSTGAYNPIFKNYEDTTISNGVSLTQNILRFTGGDYATATGTAIDLQYTNATTKCSAIKLTITGATVNEVAPYSIFIPQGNTATIENISSPAGGTIQFAMEYVAEITFNLSYAQVSSVNGLTLKTGSTYYAVYGTTPSATLTATQNHMNPPQGVEIPNNLCSYSNGIINFEPISQDVSITVTNTSMQTYAVVKELTKANVSYDTTPTYGQDFTFTVTIGEDCTQVKVSYKIGNGEYATLNNPTPNEGVYTYTIAGANIAGVVTIKAEGLSLYAIIYNANGGSFASGNTYAENIVAGATYSMPTAPTRTEYAFLGWAATNNATSPDWDTGNQTANSDKTWYAVWERVIYNVTVNIDIFYTYSSIYGVEIVWEFEININEAVPISMTKTYDRGGHHMSYSITQCFGVPQNDIGVVFKSSNADRTQQITLTFNTLANITGDIEISLQQNLGGGGSSD